MKAQQAAVVQAIARADERANKIMAAQGCELAAVAPGGTLLGVAQDMHALRKSSGKWSALHASQWIRMITRCVPAALALKPITDVKPAEIHVLVIHPLEVAGKDATAITVRRFLSDLFDYAESMEIRLGNPARAIRKECKTAVESENLGNNPAATTPEALAPVLRAISDWANPVTRAALQVQAALFQRPGDTCGMQWSHVNLDAAEWRIPVMRRTKLHKSLKGEPFHIIPLPRQVIAILRFLKPLTGHSQWVFLSTANTGGPITNDTLTNAMRTMGLGEVQTAHGFRATARSMIPKHCGATTVGQPQFVEAQLAHSIGMQDVNGKMIRDTNGTAYNREWWLEERGPMLQAWADFLDSLLTDNGAVIAVDQPEPLALPLAA